MTKLAWVVSGMRRAMLDGKGGVQERRRSRESNVFQVGGGDEFVLAQ